MADALAARMAARQIELAEQQLATEAERLAEATARFAAQLTEHRPCAGDAGRLAQDAVQVALAATRLDALRETVAYLADPKGQNRRRPAGP